MANKEHLAKLKQGVNVWNEWRSVKTEIKPDLSGADLRGANLRQNLIEVIAWGFIVMVVIVGGAKLSGSTDVSIVVIVVIESIVGGAIFLETILSEIILCGADLHEVNLRGADLRGVDLRRVDLCGADLRRANIKNIELSGLNLRGTNLSGENLSGANLSGSNLSGVNLSRTQALGANFEGATFTGACIEDWNINNETNLNHVICDFVYLKEGKQERRPSNLDKTFTPGEFTKLFKKALETVDLIFSDGIDWNAVAYSLKNVQVLNKNTTLDIQSIENKGDGVVLIRVSVPNNADKHKIESDFWQGYESAYKELAAQHQHKIEDKNKNQEINRLFLLLSQSLEKLAEVPKLMLEAKKEYHFYDSVGSVGNKGTQNNVAGVVKGNQEGTQHNYSPEQKSTLAEAAKEIQQLLKQLEKSNPTATVEQQQAFVDIAVSPTLKAKFVSAIQAGWKEAIKEFLDNSYVNVGVAILEGWQEAD